MYSYPEPTLGDYLRDALDELPYLLVGALIGAAITAGIRYLIEQVRKFGRT